MVFSKAGMCGTSCQVKTMPSVSVLNKYTKYGMCGNSCQVAAENVIVYSVEITLVMPGIHVTHSFGLEATWPRLQLHPHLRKCPDIHWRQNGFP